MLGPLTPHHIVYRGFIDISNLGKCFGVFRTKESHQWMLMIGEMDEKPSPHSIALSLEDLSVQFHLKKNKQRHCFLSKYPLQSSSNFFFFSFYPLDC